MTDEDAVLVRILAATDALWKPMRRADWGSFSIPTVLYEHRKRFASAGVASHSGATTEAGRKADQRTSEALASSGLLTLHGRERRVAARLTEKGDILARALAGLANVEAGYLSVCEVLRLESPGEWPGPMASELWLAGLDSYANSDDCRHELHAVQELALPALWRGWLESGSDIEGRVWYHATDQGRAVAKLPKPELPADLPTMDNHAADLYDAEVIAIRERLRHTAPDHCNELGCIPLSCSINLKPKEKTTSQ